MVVTDEAAASERLRVAQQQVARIRDHVAVLVRASRQRCDASSQVLAATAPAGRVRALPMSRVSRVRR